MEGGGDGDSGVPTIVANPTRSPEALGGITQTSSTGESPGSVPRSEPLSSGTTTSKPKASRSRAKIPEGTESLPVQTHPPNACSTKRSEGDVKPVPIMDSLLDKDHPGVEESSFHDVETELGSNAELSQIKGTASEILHGYSSACGRDMPPIKNRLNACLAKIRIRDTLEAEWPYTWPRVAGDQLR